MLAFALLSESSTPVAVSVRVDLQMLDGSIAYMFLVFAHACLEDEHMGGSNGEANCFPVQFDSLEASFAAARGLGGDGGGGGGGIGRGPGGDGNAGGGRPHSGQTCLFSCWSCMLHSSRLVLTIGSTPKAQSSQNVPSQTARSSFLIG